MPLDGPIVCLVTDRRRLVGADGPFDTARAALAALARDAAAAEVTLIQIREPGLEAAQLGDLVAALVDATRGSATRIVVNDRLDVALAARADGVHLRGDSISSRAARTIAPAGFLIGRSVHRVEEAREHAASSDYLIAGTVFPTGSKPASAPLLSLNGLREIAAAVRVPVLAIGGITVDRFADVAAAGAAGVAGIGLFVPGGIPLARVVGGARAQFDRATAAS